MRKKIMILTFLAMALLLVPMLVQSGEKKIDLEERIEALEAKVAALEAKLQYVSVEDGTINGLVGPHMIITGANLHLRSGDDNPGAMPNGLGNFIVGYNEPGIGVITGRMASHVVVIGNGHGYTSNTGLVAGYENTITGYAASVTGGTWNFAAGSYSSVSGGTENSAQGHGSSINGGTDNKALGINSSVSGGWLNGAEGDHSSVTGGYWNRATGELSVVSGGFENWADGKYSVVSGGKGGSAFGDQSTVSGGFGAFTRSDDGYRDWTAGGYQLIYYDYSSDTTQILTLPLP